MMDRGPGPATLGLLALAVVGLAAVPLLGDSYLVKLLSRLLILALFAMSLDLLIGIGGMVSFGHAAFFGLGAYAAWAVAPEYEAGDPGLMVGAAIGAAGAAALVIGLLVLRLRGLSFIMATLAFAQMIYYAVHDSDATGGSDGVYLHVLPRVEWGGLVLDLADRATFFWLCLAALLAGYGLLVMLLRAPFGQVLQGLRVNESRMRALGYRPGLYRLTAFVIAGMIAGLAGFLYACLDGFINPALLGWRESGLAIVMVVLGGSGRFYGAALGALALGLAEEGLREATEYWLLVLGLAIMAVALYLPGGLAGLVDRRRG